MAAVLLGMAVALAGCGGGKSEEDVETLLDRAFSRSVESADVKIDAELKIDGLDGFDRPVRIQAAGPYVAADGKLPDVDIDLKIGAAEAGQTVQSGFLSTGDRAFLKFGGEFYEQPREDVARANRELRKGGRKGSGSLRELGLNPRTWVVEAEGEDDEKIAGVATEHVSGKLDVRRMLSDLNKLVERSANAIGGAAPDVPDPLTSKELDQLAEIVPSPTFDVYVGKQDHVLRRLSASLRVTVPEKDRAQVGGIAGGTLRFTLELAKVNGDQSVKAPRSARPISDLTEQLGGARALGGATQGSEPQAPPASGAAPSAGAEPPDLGTFEEYSDCLDKARPDDTQALARCAELLR